MADVFSGSFGGDSTVATPAWRKKAKEEGVFGDNTQDPAAPGGTPSLMSSPLFQTVQKTAVENMTQAPAFDAQANEARDAYKVAQANSAKTQREQLMGFGLRDTGAYIDKGIIAPAEKDVVDRAALERSLATDRQSLMTQRQGQGMTAANALLGTLSTAQSDAAKIASSEKIAFADLDQKDRALAQEAYQFGSKQDFDKWALEKNLDNETAQRVWQSVENTKQQASTEKVAGMQNDTERWKTQYQGNLTQQGWSHESAMQATEIQAAINKDSLDRELNKYIADQGFSMEDKKLAQEAVLAGDELSFKKWAAESGYTQDAIARAWQSAENALARTSEETQNREKIQAAAYQSELDRSLTRDIEAGKLSQADKELAQQAVQFNTEEEYKKWAVGQGILETQATQAWQSAENAKDRAQSLVIANNQLYLETQKLTASIDQFDKTYGLESSKYASSLTQWQSEFNQKVKEYDTASGLEKAKLAQDLQIANNQMNNSIMLATLDNEFKLKGISLEAVLNNLGDLDPTSAADTFVEAMKQAGLNTAGIADSMKAYQSAPLPLVFGQEDSPSLMFSKDGSITTPDGSFALADGQSITLQDNFQTADKSSVVPAGKYTVKYGPVSDSTKARTIELYPVDTKNNKTYVVGQWYKGM
jgi:hypothetical protein